MAQTVQVRLLGPFAVTVGGRSTGAWPRPSARRLCELVLVSPGRRVSRDLVCEELFPDLDPRTAARSVSKALSMARAALSPLGGSASTLLEADLVHIWASPSAEVDAEAHEAALRDALATGPGKERDDLLVKALAETRQLLADEPYADWAVRPRERLEALRLQARLTLARDRAKGAGRADPEAVREAWEACFEHDPANEEAAGALVRIYFATDRRQLAARTYERCSAALRELGLRISPSLDEVYAAASFEEPAKDHLRPEPEMPKSELRTVTVLFAEVAAQVGLARKLGLEAVREMVSGSLAAVITEVEAFGGTVTSVSGGGLQAVFGAPQAHEDDPERALRAAFRALATAATAAAATAAAAVPAVALRIGVETGPALVGPIGAGGKVEYGAVGDAVGLAAALQSSAAPGSILVGPVTRAVTGHLFTWGAAEQLVPGPDTGPLTATYLGKPKPGASARRLRLGGRGPLVGRGQELALLEGALRETITGHGSVVLLTGEPGLGKTRLVQECRRRFVAWASSHGGRLPLWLEGRSASYASATPYGLYQQVLASWLGVAPDQPDAVRPALEHALGNFTGSTDLLFSPLARMMGLAPGAALGRMGPEELQRATFAALRELITGLVARSPAVLALEDLHWADPTSLRLTAELAALAPGRRLLVLITSRPSGGDDLSVITARRIDLAPLPADAERELARSLVGENAGREVLDTVLANADGNPLFLEERLSSLIETKALVRDQDQDTWHVRETTEATVPEVPQVLERLVRSRVDRLTPPAREAIRVASVLGAEFPLSLLTAVLGGTSPDTIEELLARDLLLEVPGAPEPTFRFRHALIQEATYEGLLRAERRQLHGRAAWALEARSSDNRQPPHADDAVLGRHFAAAGETERALRYLELAGDHATGAFANDEAISCYRAALAITDEQQASSDMATDTAVGVRAKLANVLWRTGRRADAREAFEDALRLASGTGTLRKAHLLTRLGRLEMAEHRYEAAEQALDAAAALLPADPAGQDDATVDQWLEMMVDGRADLYAVRHEPDRALATLEAARSVLDARGSLIRQHSFYHVLALARVIQHRYRVDEEDLANIRKALVAAEQGGEEKDVGYATFFVGWVLWLHGDLAGAREHSEASLSMGERIGETILHLESLIQLAMVAVHRHDTESVRAHAAKAMAVAEATNEDRHLPRIRGCLAWLAWQDGRPGDVIELAGLAAESREFTNHGFFFHRWVYLWPLVALHLESGDIPAAVAAARQMLDPSQQRLPGSLESLTEQACQAWDDSEPEAAQSKLADALRLAHDLGYF
ncbi:MAG: AAA family ATPase [Streptosporangiaceae bacterium]|nr:AAA family ATPase [Streptosporangiaceae bacterium]